MVDCPRINSNWFFNTIAAYINLCSHSLLKLHGVTHKLKLHLSGLNYHEIHYMRWKNIGLEGNTIKTKEGHIECYSKNDQEQTVPYVYAEPYQTKDINLQPNETDFYLQMKNIS